MQSASRHTDNAQKRTADLCAVTFVAQQDLVSASSQRSKLWQQIQRQQRKSTPYAASQVAESVAKKAAPLGIKEINVFTTGIGAGRDSAVRSLHGAGMNILSIKDVTPTPHNGCRPSRPRRL
ncbi:30S ribosomal protein S11 [Candidatus Uhrbacteria bacterium]|nr:30S ribosomal protein S11 [Candidatus Uhrbacteria bacterium]